MCLASPSNHPDEPCSPIRSKPQPNTHHHTREDLTSRKESQNQDNAFLRRQESQPGVNADQPIDPELIKLEPVTGPGYEEALKAWARFRFVRAGWFTASEAIEYID